MSIGNCVYCGQYGGHTPTCKGVAEQKKRIERDAEIAYLTRIDSLALQGALTTVHERDAEIERLCESVNAKHSKICDLGNVVDAQRKVLEQALEALEFAVKTSSWPERAQQMYVPVITAIKESK
ncbi:MAG: hypothetical protein WC829_09905 [Hyphomicrobium sp.]|jgi:hypothetical protein